MVIPLSVPPLHNPIHVLPIATCVPCVCTYLHSTLHMGTSDGTNNESDRRGESGLQGNLKVSAPREGQTRCHKVGPQRVE